MKAIVFASYKGGVGRTYAAVTTANTLARYGYNVVLVDLDIDAPSIPTMYNRPVWGVDDAPPIGVVPWVLGKSGALADNLIEEPTLSGGRLRLFPSGPVGEDYLDDLLDVRWREMVDLDPEGFGERLRREFLRLDDPPDFLIVDSRSGLAPVSASVLTHLADTIAFLFAGDPESVQIANSLEEERGDAIVFPVLTRFPKFIDPEMKTIEENLKELDDKDRLCFLHAAPGHEGSTVATIGLTSVNAESPLTLDHFRLAQKLEPKLTLEPPSEDQPLVDIWQRAERGIPIDYKLFRVVARGHMVNLADSSRNVAFKVDTITSILETVTAGLEPTHAAEALRAAGEVAGSAFGASLGRDLNDNGERAPDRRLAAWCGFDSSTGFGNMEAVTGPNHDESDPNNWDVIVYVRDAFLNPARRGQELLEGYVSGVVKALISPVPEIDPPVWEEGSTLKIRVRPQAKS